MTTGMTLVHQQDVTASSTLSINNCFTSTYRNYQVMIAGLSTSNTGMYFRYRSAGSDNSTASSYTTQYLFSDGTSTTGLRAADGKGEIGASISTLGFLIEAEISGVWAADYTTMVSKCSDGFNNARMRLQVGTHNQVASYDGITLFPGSGTWTGIVRIYGFSN